MEVTRQMGVQYLWIDDLCIQDCEEGSYSDQIKDMHRVYGNAQFAIIAAQGTATEGLAGVRPRETSARVINGVEVNDTLAFVNSRPLPKSIAKSPWVTRGWCLQEQLLSKRFLVFWDNQVYWQCSKTMEFEDMPLSMKPDYVKTLSKRARQSENTIDTTTPVMKHSRLPFGVRGLGIDLGSAHMDGSSSWTHSTMEQGKLGTIVVRTPLFREYTSIVNLYTSRTLTRDDDALNAVDGLLSLISIGLATPMLYGLPECLLDTALLWYADQPLRRRCRGTIPSWSWAGWKEGRIAYQASTEFEPRSRKLVPSTTDHQEDVKPFVVWWKAGEESESGSAAVLVNETGAGVKTDSRTRPHDWRYMEKVLDYIEPQAGRTPSQVPHPLGPMYLQFGTMCCLDIVDDLGDNGDLIEQRTQYCAGRIYTDSQKPISSLKSSARPRKERLALVVLSEAQYFSSGQLNERLSLYEYEFKYLLYNVLLVLLNRTTGVASRLGIGKVYKRHWNSHIPEWRMIRLR
ncbi:hypothetical protein LTR36_001541 [Oleoguttula mirabilis]|uniref:Heterokaryon incompatibility domain-containing protein n=1 Tax=Oleoguttula mirabilis TaxID=1507867 RepID=A0AAV9JNU4_9PEZI|nr:hypothetical protein LTR36_001541 [Oleoguttula mirabilis]